MKNYQITYMLSVENFMSISEQTMAIQASSEKNAHEIFRASFESREIVIIDIIEV